MVPRCETVKLSENSTELYEGEGLRLDQDMRKLYRFETTFKNLLESLWPLHRPEKCLGLWRLVDSDRAMQTVLVGPVLVSTTFSSEPLAIPSGQNIAPEPPAQLPASLLAAFQNIGAFLKSSDEPPATSIKAVLTNSTLEESPPRSTEGHQYLEIKPTLDHGYTFRNADLTLEVRSNFTVSFLQQCWESFNQKCDDERLISKTDLVVLKKETKDDLVVSWRLEGNLNLGYLLMHKILITP